MQQTRKRGDHGVPACFAPPIDQAKLAAYRQLASDCKDAQVASFMSELADMVELFLKTPPSTLTPQVVPVGGKAVKDGRQITHVNATPLADDEIQRIWDAVPWQSEINAMADVFDSIPPTSNKKLRDAAFHLLWYASELTRDREPMTSDKL